MYIMEVHAHIHTYILTHTSPLQVVKCSFSLAYKVRQSYAYSSYGEVGDVLVADLALMALILLFDTGCRAALIIFLVGGEIVMVMVMVIVIVMVMMMVMVMVVLGWGIMPRL